MSPNRAAIVVVVLILVGGIVFEYGLRFAFNEADASTNQTKMPANAHFVETYTTKSDYIVVVDKQYRNPQIIQILRRLDESCAEDCIIEQPINPEGNNTFKLALSPNMDVIRFQVQVDSPNGRGRVYLNNHGQGIKIYDGTSNHRREIGLWTMGAYRGGTLFTIQEFTTKN